MHSEAYYCDVVGFIVSCSCKYISINRMTIEQCFAEQRLEKLIGDGNLPCPLCQSTDVALCERVMPIQLVSINGMFTHASARYDGRLVR